MLLVGLFERCFGNWECVVSHTPDPRYNILIVCHKHSVTGRVKGYVSTATNIHILRKHVVLGHIKEYGIKK